MLDNLSNEDIKDSLHATKMLKELLEKWKYVSVNAPYMDKEVVAEALSQMVELFTLLIDSGQMAMEAFALTKLDPTDLI